MFTLIAPQLGRVMVTDRIRDADRARTRVEARQHRLQRERVRASLIVRPEPHSAGRA